MRKVVLITGASRGIGASIALEFASHNYDLILTYNEDKIGINEIKSKINDKYDVNVAIYQCDSSQEKDVKSLLSKINDIDILINNAGMAIDNDYTLKTAEEFQRVMNTNLLGTFLFNKYVGQKMLKKRQGSIVNISSTNGIDTCYQESMDYDASKAGVISLTHNFALALSPDVRVNSIAPGWINTSMNKNLSPKFKEQEKNRILLKRFGEAIEIAKIVYFIAVEATYVNNEIIRVDGGSFGGSYENR